MKKEVFFSRYISIHALLPDVLCFHPIRANVRCLQPINDNPKTFYSVYFPTLSTVRCRIVSLCFSRLLVAKR